MSCEQCAAMRAAALQYVDHETTCPTWLSSENECNCGVQAIKDGTAAKAILERLRKAQAEAAAAVGFAREFIEADDGTTLWHGIANRARRVVDGTAAKALLEQLADAESSLSALGGDKAVEYLAKLEAVREAAEVYRINTLYSNFLVLAAALDKVKTDG